MAHIYSQHHFPPPLHYSEKSPTDLENNPLKIRQRIRAASFSAGLSTVNTLDSTNCFPQEGHTECSWGGREGRVKRRIYAICPRKELCLCVTRTKCVVGGGVCRASVSRPVLCKVKAPQSCIPPHAVHLTESYNLKERATPGRRPHNSGHVARRRPERYVKDARRTATFIYQPQNNTLPTLEGNDLIAEYNTLPKKARPFLQPKRKRRGSQYKRFVPAVTKVCKFTVNKIKTKIY